MSACSQESTGLNPGFSTGCSNQGPLSNATWTTGISLATSFVGKVYSDLTAGTTTGLLPYGSITDWSRFDNLFRGWGLEGSAFPSADNAGRCTSGSCRLWDWRRAPADTVLRLGSAFHAPINGVPQPCPPEAAGSESLTNVAGTRYLRSAIELIGTGGNDNGLCEAGETCLYAPNIGACTYDANGGLAGVTLYGYETNGQ